MADTIAMTGYSTTRSLYDYMTTLMYDHTIWGPVRDGGTPLWGLSSDWENVIVPLVKALVPEPVLLWVGVGGAWDMRRTPLIGSPFVISVANYGINMTNGLNDLLANTTIPRIIVADCVPIDRTSTDQGDPPAPYRFEVDAALYRTELINVINAIGDPRLTFYSYNQAVIDNNTNQPDGIHFDSPGNITMSIILSEYFRRFVGGENPLAEKLDLTGATLNIAPFAWGEGNGKTSINVGVIPTPGAIGQPATLTNFGAGFGYRYVPNDSHLLFEGGNDVVEPVYSIPFTNANDVTWEFKGMVLNSGTQRYIAGHDNVGNSYWYFRVDNTNKMRFFMNKNLVGSIDVKVNIPVIAEGFNSIVLRKTGPTMQLFAQGVEATNYSVQDNYNLGNTTLLGNMSIGNWDAGFGFWAGRYYRFTIYMRALSDAEILSNHILGKQDGGLIGDNAGDNMRLYYPVAPSATIAQSKIAISTGIGMGM